MLTQKRLRTLLIYEPSTGKFYWRMRRGGKANSGSVAGSVDTKGKIQIQVDRRLYHAHRLAFLYMLGRWPKNQVDHKNGVADDNRWKNLRECDGFQNQLNRPPRRRKNLLPQGVYSMTRGPRYFSTICYRGTRLYVGSFDTPAEAHAAYLSARRCLVKGDDVKFLPH